MRFVVSGDSMEPAYSHGNKLFACRFWYRFTKPKKGNVVIVRDPRDNRFLLKRIESIDGVVFRVAGDNSDESTDRREFGSVSKELIMGKVLFKYKASIDNENL